MILLCNAQRYLSELIRIKVCIDYTDASISVINTSTRQAHPEGWSQLIISTLGA